MTIKLYEKKESLETLILGINQDPDRVNFHAYVKQLGLTPQLETLEETSPYSLIVEIGGTPTECHQYPNAEKTAELFDVELDLLKNVAQKSTILNAANTTRIGNCCGVGEDIYVDPNEEN